MLRAMTGLHVELDPSDGDIDELRERLIAYNISKHGYHDRFKAAIFVRNDDGSLAGGIYAHGWGGCCEVELLWVSEDRRGEGLGGRLISAVEDEARRHGCSKIVLDTFSFQAPGFYEKQGFGLVTTIDDFPEGHRYHVMVKQL